MDQDFGASSGALAGNWTGNSTPSWSHGVPACSKSAADFLLLGKSAKGRMEGRGGALPQFVRVTYCFFMDCGANMRGGGVVSIAECETRRAQVYSARPACPQKGSGTEFPDVLEKDRAKVVARC